MTPILDGLHFAPRLPLGALVYLGFGDGSQWGVTAELQAQRYVLVEGDPEVASELRSNVPARDSVEVHALVLAPAAGPLSWHRYNLSWLNGPIDRLALRTIYPRLLVSHQADRPAHGVDGWLAGLDVQTGPDRDNLLVIDLPGQEADLLAAVRTEALQAFKWIVIRGCTLDTADQRVSGHLADRGFCLTGPVAEAESLWPVSLFAFDEPAWQQGRTAQGLAALQDKLAGATLALASCQEQRAEQQLQNEQLSAALEAARADAAERERLLSEARAQADSQERELGELRGALGAQRESNLIELDAVKSQVRALQEELLAMRGHLEQALAAGRDVEGLRTRLAELGATEAESRANLAAAVEHAQELGRELELLKRTSLDNASRAEALRLEHDDLQAQLHSAQIACTTEAARAAEFSRRIDLLEGEREALRLRLQAETSLLEQVRSDAHAKQQDQAQRLQGLMDELARTAAQNERTAESHVQLKAAVEHAQALQREIDSLRRDAVDHEAHAYALRLERGEMQAQLAALRNQFATEAERAADLGRRVDALDHARSELLDKLTTESGRLAEVQREAQARQQEDARRLQGLKEELVRAEVQIELIKDLLLREPGL